MSYEEAVAKLQEIVGNDLESFECHGIKNASENFEFFVTKKDQSKVVIHIGNSIIVKD
jgi:hypothetical protein